MSTTDISRFSFFSAKAGMRTFIGFLLVLFF